MPRALIRSKASRSRLNKLESANHTRKKRGFSPAPDQRQDHDRCHEQSDKTDHDGPDMLGLCLQRNRIAVVGPDGLHAGNPQSYLHLVAYRAWKVQITSLLNDAAIDGFGPGNRSRPETAHHLGNSQLWRKPSAARFHCATLSAIMRVDFMAAWLSWA
jgi:hypothetical protein